METVEPPPKAEKEAEEPAEGEDTTKADAPDEGDGEKTED